MMGGDRQDKTGQESMHPWNEHDLGGKQTDDTSRGITKFGTQSMRQ